MSWENILKVKVYDSPIGDMEQYEIDTLRNENEDMRYEGWPTNKAELKELLESDANNAWKFLKFYEIMGDTKSVKVWMDKGLKLQKLIQGINNAFPEDNLKGLFDESNEYNQALSDSNWRLNTKLDKIKRLLNEH